MIFENKRLLRYTYILKNGANPGTMKNEAVKSNFYHMYQNSNMHKKVDMLNRMNLEWG